MRWGGAGSSGAGPRGSPPPGAWAGERAAVRVPVAQPGRFPVGMVIAVVVVEEPLLRNAMATPRRNWSNT